jgi:catechol 2,3-dioxygenase-like lactoylglutathione lyase family enzyme
MTALLNHTIVWSHDPHRSADFFAEILGLPAAQPFHHFMVLSLGNDVSLDFMAHEGPIARQHYAFLVSEDEFDAGFAKLKARNNPYWADPARSHPGEINRHWGGRGVYFEDPNGHLLEMITKPYGAEDEL